jgi:hypothetical protein
VHRKRVVHDSLSFRIEVAAVLRGARRLFAVVLLAWEAQCRNGMYLRASPRLSSLTLEPSHALLPPFRSHLVGWLFMRLVVAIGAMRGRWEG